MLELFLASENMVFSISLVIMLLIGVVELISAGAASGVLDNIIPDFDGDIDTEVDIPALSKLLGWIRPGKVPILIYLIVFLMTFSLAGFIGQSIVKHIITIYLPWFLAVPGACFVAIFISRIVTLIASKVVIKDESSAVPVKNFIGKIATITIGTARVGCPAEARLKDKFGQTHYVQVEPDDGNEFKQGSDVLLVSKEKGIFKCIKNTNVNLQK